VGTPNIVEPGVTYPPYPVSRQALNHRGCCFCYLLLLLLLNYWPVASLLLKACATWPAGPMLTATGLTLVKGSSAELKSCKHRQPSLPDVRTEPQPFHAIPIQTETEKTKDIHRHRQTDRQMGREINIDKVHQQVRKNSSLPNMCWFPWT